MSEKISQPAMSEEDQKLYLEEYPDAVQNVDKAHVMAKAGHEYRSSAADFRRIGSRLVDAYVENPDTVISSLENRKNELIDRMNASEGKDKEAQSELNDIHATLRRYRPGGDVRKVIKEVTGTMKREENGGDSLENAAELRYERAVGLRADIDGKELPEYASDDERKTVERLKRVGNILIDGYVNNPGPVRVSVVLEDRMKELREVIMKSEGVNEEALRDRDDIAMALSFHKLGDDVLESIKQVSGQLDRLNQQALGTKKAEEARASEADDVRAALGIEK